MSTAIFNSPDHAIDWLRKHGLVSTTEGTKVFLRRRAPNTEEIEEMNAGAMTSLKRWGYSLVNPMNGPFGWSASTIPESIFSIPPTTGYVFTGNAGSVMHSPPVDILSVQDMESSLIDGALADRETAIDPN